MPVYLVDRTLPDATLADLAAAQKAAISTSRAFTAAGRAVRYIRSTFIPGEARCMCLFEAGSRDDVRAVNEAASLPFSRIVEAADLPAPER